MSGPVKDVPVWEVVTRYQSRDMSFVPSGIRPPLYYMGKTHVVQGFQPANVVHVSAPL